MQNGKLLPSHRNVVIQSIKPKRPNYPAHQKLVPAKESLKEWDKLDAYYRGQLLKFNVKGQKKQLPVKKKKSSANNAKHVVPDDLFGDENSFYGDDGQITADRDDKDDYESDIVDYYDDDDYYDDKILKKEPKSETRARPGLKYICDEKEKSLENFLAISKEDFTVKLDANNKKRCWQKGKNTKMLRPVLTSNYRPPVAAGFNSIHIQKILYHKCTTESPERVSSGITPTTNGLTLTKQIDKEKPAIKQNVPKLRDSNHSTVSNSTSKTTPPVPQNQTQPISATNKNKNKDLLSNSQLSNPPTNNNTNKNKNLDKKYKSSCDNEHSSNENQNQKRKSESADRQKSKQRKMDSESPVPVSSTSELFEKTSPANKKQKYSSSSSTDTENSPSENAQRRYSISSESMTTTITTPTNNHKGPESLVNTIVNQSKKSFESVNKKDSDMRERQRTLESKSRKRYALKKGQEHEELESIELAFKSFELILDYPPLSPIRSPPMSRWS